MKDRPKTSWSRIIEQERTKFGWNSRRQQEQQPRTDRDVGGVSGSYVLVLVGTKRIPVCEW